MATSDKYAGTATSLSNSFYLRKFYTSTPDARTKSKRSEFSDSELSLADGMALRRAVKRLGSFSYDETEDTNIRNSVLAYISTYNNTLESASDSSDRTLTRAAKQLKSLTEEYADDLDKIGITVNEDGTLTSRETLFKAADISKFKDLFSSDSSYMQHATAYSKRIERRSEALSFAEKQQLLQQSAKKASESTSDSETTSIAALLAKSANTASLLPDGVGENINVSL